MCVGMKAQDQLMRLHIKRRCAHPRQFILPRDPIVAARPHPAREPPKYERRQPCPVSSVWTIPPDWD